MIKQKIQVLKTVRFFTAGHLNKKTKNVWLVLHGYGQTADEFLKKFDSVFTEENFFIAPEALNRFYTKRFSGKVGASWMTCEERDDEINDYINYLNQLLKNFNFSKNANINILGFSQGTSTASRFLIQSEIRFSNLFLWGGAPAFELQAKKYADKFNSTNLQIVIGENDKFIKKEMLEKIEVDLESAGINFSLIKYEGDHDIDEETLRNIFTNN